MTEQLTIQLASRRPTQCERLLACLEDGRWWTTSALLRRVPCIVHSRISDLRAQGYIVEHRTTGVGADGSSYRLVVAQSEAA